MSDARSLATQAVDQVIAWTVTALRPDLTYALTLPAAMSSTDRDSTVRRLSTQMQEQGERGLTFPAILVLDPSIRLDEMPIEDLEAALAAAKAANGTKEGV